MASLDELLGNSTCESQSNGCAVEKGQATLPKDHSSRYARRPLKMNTNIPWQIMQLYCMQITFLLIHVLVYT